MIKNHNFYLIITNTALNLLKFKKDCVILYKMKANYIRKINTFRVWKSILYIYLIFIVWDFIIIETEVIQYA